MRIELDGLTGEEVAKRAFFLAWIACGGPVGLGILQNRPGATEEDVWQNVADAGDYPGRIKDDRPGEVSGDYVFGRMMKLTIRYGADWVEVSDSTPCADYQSWCRKYATYKDLIDGAVAGLRQAA